MITRYRNSAHPATRVLKVARASNREVLARAGNLAGDRRWLALRPSAGVRPSDVLRGSLAVFASFPHAAGVGALANPGRLAGASCCMCVPAAPSPFPVGEIMGWVHAL